MTDPVIDESILSAIMSNEGVDHSAAVHLARQRQDAGEALVRYVGDHVPDRAAPPTAAIPPEIAEEIAHGYGDLRIPDTLARTAPAGLRAFAVRREYDSNGRSGTGVVFEGVIFSTGVVVIHWLTPPPGGSVASFPTWQQMVDTHLLSHPENRASISFYDGQQVNPEQVATFNPFAR